MFYLIVQMALYLILATLAGVGIGWWINELRGKPQTTEMLIEDDNLIAIKRRLDQCFDDNAKLRRDLKASKQSSRKHFPGNETTGETSTETLNEKIKVLMDDLQLRDDTLSALERELEKVRNSQD